MISFFKYYCFFDFKKFIGLLLWQRDCKCFKFEVGFVCDKFWIFFLRGEYCIFQCVIFQFKDLKILRKFVFWSDFLFNGYIFKEDVFIFGYIIDDNFFGNRMFFVNEFWIVFNFVCVLGYFCCYYLWYMVVQNSVFQNGQFGFFWYDYFFIVKCIIKLFLNNIVFSKIID